MLSKGITNMTAPVEMARVSSLVDLARRYHWAMNDANLDIAKEIGLTGIKKYWKYVGQVEIKLD